MQEPQITIFGSGNIAKGSREWREAKEVGFLLAKRGFTIVNGGYGGSMRACAEGAKEAKGTTIGVTTDEFSGAAKNPFVDQEIRMPSWWERLHELVRRGDGFIVLDGGTGTLTEMMVIWEMLNKRLHQKPVVILGRRLRSLVRVLKRNPEICIPDELYLAKTPRDAVQYLIKKLTHGRIVSS